MVAVPLLDLRRLPAGCRLRENLDQTLVVIFKRPAERGLLCCPATGCPALWVKKPLRSELGAIPHFRVYTYAETDGDPVCGWLTGFETFVRSTCEDLTRLPMTEPVIAAVAAQ